MASTNLNIRTDKDVKEQAERIFAELGINMSTAINMFLRTTIRENGIPFALKLETPNELTAAAIAEGRRIASDDSVKGYRDMDELKCALFEQIEDAYDVAVAAKAYAEYERSGRKSRPISELWKELDL